jgi:uncharacterized membrane protein YeaQ/YmgE (transglycosylase-associated protein family)
VTYAKRGSVCQPAELGALLSHGIAAPYFARRVQSGLKWRALDSGNMLALRATARHSGLERKEQMNFLAWLILGLLAGFIGSKIVNRQGEGLIRDILLGIVGAFVGGFLFRTFGGRGVTGLDLYSLLVAVIGSIVVLVLFHALRRAV